MKNSKTFSIIIDKNIDGEQPENQDSTKFIPEDEDIHRWIESTLLSEGKSYSTELGLRITNNNEIQNLNNTYRHKDKATNVLAFPFELPENFPEALEDEYLGDIICSAEYINTEAQNNNKELIHHWAHIIIHGTLHLLGYDHIENNDAAIMENKEIEILKSLNFPNPYS